MVDVGGYGKSSDGGIFSMGKAIEKQNLMLPKAETISTYGEPLLPYVFIGDEAFPLKNLLLRLYPRRSIEDDTTKSVYNYRLCRATRVVENAFGILVQKFRVFYNKINMKPENVDKVVLAAYALHNYLRNDMVPSSVELEECTSQPDGLRNLQPSGYHHDSDEALRVRENFKNYFNSVIGSVPWQQEAVRGIQMIKKIVKMWNNFQSIFIYLYFT